MNLALVAFVALAVVAAAALLAPLLAGRRSPWVGRAEHHVAVHRGRLAQIDRDVAAGLLDPEEAEAVRAEVGRALLAAAREAEREARQRAAGSGSRLALAGAAALVVAVSAGLYSVKGSFHLATRPAAESVPGSRVAVPANPLSEHEGTSLAEAIPSPKARLAQNPDNVENWLLLARSYSAIGNHAEAAEAYRRVIELAPTRLDIRGDYGEALVLAQDGFVGPEAMSAFEIVLAHEPKDPRARYYLALREAQADRPAEAIRAWAEILRDAPPEAPYRPGIRRIIELVLQETGLDRSAFDIPDEPAAEPATAASPRAMPGPSAEDVATAAEMPPEEQLAMIRGMVERLEERLAEDSGDIEGWLRLARSRVVLGEPEAAVAALERALEANSGNVRIEATLAEIRASLDR